MQQLVKTISRFPSLIKCLNIWLATSIIISWTVTRGIIRFQLLLRNKKRLRSHVHLGHLLIVECLSAPTAFQRCMLSLFSDMVEWFFEIFMNDFSIYRDSFTQCLHHLELILQCCAKKNLTLNWEKFYFMVRHGIVLGHEISKKGIEVDRAKIEVITKLPMPKCLKDIRSFLRHTSFYQRLIKDFSKIAKPLTNLLAKDVSFTFDVECMNSWEKLNKELISASIISAPD